MTKGNTKLIFRVSAELLAAMKDAIGRRNRRSREEPWDMSGFVRCAIRDKLSHMNRSRRRGHARQASNEQPAKVEG